MCGPAQLVYFSSRSGNTERFVAALGLPAQKIGADTPPPPGDGPVILVCPTYGDGEGRGAVPKPVIRYLNEPANRARIRGIIAAGNRNFGPTFALAGDIIAQKLNVPVLYRFELAGTETDIARVRDGLHQFRGLTCSTMA